MTPQRSSPTNGSISHGVAPLGLTEEMLSAPSSGPKRILSIEGGGVRGVFSLEILFKMEEALRAEYGKKDLVLADHFHLIAGTSVGAILGTYLSYGWSVGDLRALFAREMPLIFSRAKWWKLSGAAFRRGPLREMLQKHFVEEDGTPALFGTQRLKTWLLIVVRNLSTGSAWPLLNHPEGRYNKPELGPESNLAIPLWQLVRASTAAPWFFPPERVKLGTDLEVEFVDGGITPYNNPSVIAYLMATLPCFPLQWKKGVENLVCVSVGSGRVRAKLGMLERGRLGRLRFLDHVPAALIESTSFEQDLVMRSMGHCRHGEDLDGELGALMADARTDDAFAYCRYNQTFTPGEITSACKEARCNFSLSAVKLAPWLKQKGQAYATKAVKHEHQF